MRRRGPRRARIGKAIGPHSLPARSFLAGLLSLVALIATVHAQAPALTEAQIQSLDRDRDGRLLREEARSQPRLLELWEDLDRDGDGVLSAAEIGGTGGGPLGEPR